MKSLGFDVVAVSTGGIVAPAGTPPEVVNILSQSMRRVIESESHRQYLKQLGDITPYYRGPDEFAASWREYEARLRPLLKKLREE